MDHHKKNSIDTKLSRQERRGEVKVVMRLTVRCAQNEEGCALFYAESTAMRRDEAVMAVGGGRKGGGRIFDRYDLNRAKKMRANEQCRFTYSHSQTRSVHYLKRLQGRRLSSNQHHHRVKILCNYFHVSCVPLLSSSAAKFCHVR